MDVTELFHQLQLDLLIHSEQYRFYIEAATIAVLCYVGYTDFRTFKIRNDSIILLLILYVLYATLKRSPFEIISNVVLAVVMFGVLLLFYTKRLIGGGDVKLLSVVCLWVSTRCALLFAAALLVLIGLHLAAVSLGWSRAENINGRSRVPYAPSVAGALIISILLGCA